MPEYCETRRGGDIPGKSDPLALVERDRESGFHLTALGRTLALPDLLM